MAQIHKKTLEKLAVIAYAYHEIDLATAINITGWEQSKIEDAAAVRVAKYQKILDRANQATEELNELRWQYEHARHLAIREAILALKQLG